MKKFLLKITVFLKCIVLFIATLVFLRVVIIGGFNYKLPDDKKYLFIGDSRFRVGVDDRLLPGALNVSADADNYLTAFLRIKFLLKNKNSVNLIFIVFSPDVMGDDADSRLYANYLMAGKVPQYFPLYSIEEWKTYFEYSPKKLLHNVSGRPFRLLKGLLSEDTFCRELGGFRVSTTNNLRAGIEKHTNPSREKELPPVYGNRTSLSYLSKIRSYCAKKNIRVIGIAMPHYLAGRVFDLQKYRETLKTRYPDFEVWDYLEMELPDDCWQDINHLNYKGAQIFTKELLVRMKKEGIIAHTSRD